SPRTPVRWRIRRSWISWLRPTDPSRAKGAGAERFAGFDATHIAKRCDVAADPPLRTSWLRPTDPSRAEGAGAERFAGFDATHIAKRCDVAAEPSLRIRWRKPTDPEAAAGRQAPCGFALFCRTYARLTRHCCSRREKCGTSPGRAVLRVF